MGIGGVIAEKRKKRGITQQELADFIGVSKASVSKWETGQTYPDISLLPMLAAYFDISIDYLLDYNSQLSVEEIQRVYSALKQSFQHKSGEEVLADIRRFTRRYYSCYSFVLQIGLLILNHYDQFPGAEMEKKRQQYVGEAKELFVHVRKNSTERKLVAQAANYEAYALLLLQQADEVLDILGEFVPVYFPVETLIAGAFQQKGKQEQAITTMQSALAQYVFVMTSLFSNYLQLLIGQKDAFKETYLRGKELVDIFRLKKLHPVIWMNFQLSALTGFAQIGYEEEAYECLVEFTAVLKKLKFPLVLHGDSYFNQIQPWLAQLDLGNQMPRETNMVKNGFISVIVDNPLFEAFSEDRRFQKIFNELRALRSEGE